MERKIGEKFEYKPGVWLIAVRENSNCLGCFFDVPCCKDCNVTGSCSGYDRSDREGIIFKQFFPGEKADKTAELEARILRLEQMFSLEPVDVNPNEMYKKGWSRARREAIDENFKKTIDKLSE